jgi:homocysteine S-methyltransferase
MECLLEMGCDLLAIESIPCIKEARAIIKLLATFPDAKAWLSFTCKDELRLSNGDSFKEAYDTFKSNEQLVAIGINCSSPYHVTGLLESVVGGGEGPLAKPFVVYPNDGRTFDGANKMYVTSKH